MARKRCAGFGLLEAIVALTLFAAAGMALFSWINANLERAGRLAAREAEIRALFLALAQAEALDPVTQPQGRWQPDGDTRVDWQCRQLGPRRAVMHLPGGTSTPFEIAAFETELTVRTPGLDKPYTLRLRRLGLWREPFQGQPQ